MIISLVKMKIITECNDSGMKREVIGEPTTLIVAISKEKKHQSIYFSKKKFDPMNDVTEIDSETLKPFFSVIGIDEKKMFDDFRTYFFELNFKNNSIIFSKIDFDGVAKTEKI